MRNKPLMATATAVLSLMMATTPTGTIYSQADIITITCDTGMHGARVSCSDVERYNNRLLTLTGELLTGKCGDSGQTTGMRLLYRMSEGGDARAQYCLAWAYMHGLRPGKAEGPRDKVVAYWLSELIVRGNVSDLVVFSENFGIPAPERMNDDALAWFHRSATAGYAPAVVVMWLVARFPKESSTPLDDPTVVGRSRKYVEELCRINEPFSLALMGSMYRRLIIESGHEKVTERCYQHAIPQLVILAKKGDHRALSVLVSTIESGYNLDEFGVPDLPILKSRLRQAMLRYAEAKADAMWYYELGRDLEFGTNGERDLVAAMGWYKKAADRKHLKAMGRLGFMYAMEGFTGRDMAASKKWREAAERLRVLAEVRPDVESTGESP